LISRTLSIVAVLLLQLIMTRDSGVCAFAQAKAENIIIHGGSSDPLSQTPKGFVAILQKAAKEPLSEGELQKVLSNYSHLLPTYYSEYEDPVIGDDEYQPLQDLKTKEFYPDTIKRLIESPISTSRVLAYATLAAGNDASFNEVLRKAAKNERSSYARYWAGLTLIFLKDDHVLELFDFMVENEDFSDPHMMAFFLALDHDLLRTAAYARISSHRRKVRNLALHSLAVTKLNSKTETLVKEAFKRSVRLSVKVNALYTMKELRMGTLKDTVRFALHFKKSRPLALLALANSPTPEDQDFLNSLAKADPLSTEILDVYFLSTNPQNVRTWLSLVRDRQMPEDHSIFFKDQPLLCSDEFLTEVKETLRQSRNEKINEQLAAALKGRSDDDSVQLLVDLLSSPKGGVKYWAAKSLSGVKSERVRDRVSALLNSQSRTPSLIDLAIANNVSTLHDALYDTLKEDEKGWRRSVVEYVSQFPRPDDREFLRSMLRENNEVIIRRRAARGLGRLHDESAVELVVDAMHRESPHDLNAYSYLLALGDIQGEKARMIVESFKNSDNLAIHSLCQRLLQQWKI